MEERRVRFASGSREGGADTPFNFHQLVHTLLDIAARDLPAKDVKTDFHSANGSTSFDRRVWEIENGIFPEVAANDDDNEQSNAPVAATVPGVTRDLLPGAGITLSRVPSRKFAPPVDDNEDDGEKQLHGNGGDVLGATDTRSHLDLTGPHPVCIGTEKSDPSVLKVRVADEETSLESDEIGLVHPAEWVAAYRLYDLQRDFQQQVCERMDLQDLRTAVWLSLLHVRV